MKEELSPQELRLGPVSHRSKVATMPVDDGFDEAEERKKIIALIRKITAENKKARPDSVVIARHEREIVLIRQNIIQHMMKSTKR